MNQRSRQKFYSVLTATVGTLYERGLIAVRYLLTILKFLKSVHCIFRVHLYFPFIYHPIIIEKRYLYFLRGPESELNITKMIVTEIRQDNSKLIMLAPPMLSILVTEELFNKYFNNSNTPHG